MEFTAKQIAELTGGTIEGNPEVIVNHVSKIEEGTSGSLSFLANPLYTKYIYSTDASIVIVNNDFRPEKKIGSTLIRVENAYEAFAKLLEAYRTIQTCKSGIEEPSYIDATARIGRDVYIGAFAYVGKNVVIGDSVKIYPHTYIGDNSEISDRSVIYSGVRIYQDCKIGYDCIIHSGVVIGSDGFGFAPQSDKDYAKVPQIGNVIIEDSVEIGSNTAIDRATLGSTIIRRGVKLDNLIQVAHNVEIGENTVIAAQTGISGSTKIGGDCMIGGQVGIIGHLTIADEVKIAAQSGIGKNIDKKGEIVQGSPAFSVSDYQRSYVVFRRLPDIRKQLTELEKEVERMKKE
ncbi:MAG: UDP-3-O-(3-hydroxymyristoyl)glucosamine N-acyltransferase [Bacteroidetes bacterium]|nr:UDP-3-O-(3-hydroxymyristoyl)glucosamine N-acyltransferase [Bacteroidota bacterium]